MSRSDIILVKSENMSQDSNGGGERTPIQVVDGKTGDIFPDMNTLDLVGGDMSLNKVFFGYNTSDDAMFSGAHCYVTKPADSDIINTTMFIANDRLEERFEAVERLESYTYIEELDTSEKETFQVQTVGNPIVTQLGTGYNSFFLDRELTSGTQFIVMRNSRKSYAHHMAKVESIDSETIVISPAMPAYLAQPSEANYITVETANPTNMPVEVKEAIAGQNTIKTVGNLVTSEYIVLTDTVGLQQSNKIIGGGGTDTLTIEHPISTRLQPPLTMQGLTYKKSPTQFYSAKEADSAYNIGDTVLAVQSVTQRIKPVTTSYTTSTGTIAIPATDPVGVIDDVVIGTPWMGLPTLRHTVTVANVVRPFTFNSPEPIMNGAANVAWTSFQGTENNGNTLGSKSGNTVKSDDASDLFNLPANIRQYAGLVNVDSNTVTIDDTARVTTQISIDVVPTANYRTETIPLDFSTNGQVDADGRTYLTFADGGVTIPLAGSESIKPHSVMWWVYDPLSPTWTSSKAHWVYKGGYYAWVRTIYQEVVMYFDDGVGGLYRVNTVNTLTGDPVFSTGNVRNDHTFKFCFDDGLSVDRDFLYRPSDINYNLASHKATKIGNIDYATGIITGYGDALDVMWYEDELVDNSIYVETTPVAGFDLPAATKADRSYFTLPLPTYKTFDRSTLNLRFRKDSDDSLITGSTDASGNITGTGITSGTVSSDFVVDIEFSESVKLSVDYDIEENSVESLPFDNTGIEPYLVPVDGQIEVYNPYEYVVIHNTESIDVNTQTNAQVVACGRSVDFVDVIDAAGSKLWTVANTHYTVNKTTGDVTLHGDWVGAGFIAPFRISHVISETALVDTVDYENATVSIDRPLQKAYPQVGTYVSNAMPLGDLQASVKVLYDSISWDGEWSDVNKGTDSLNSFDDSNYPITTTNEGCFDGLYVIQFNSSTSFTVYHESLGAMGTGSTSSDTVITRSGKVVMTIPALGFGGSWSSGNIIMVKGKSAFQGVWMLRTIDPTQQSTATYDVGLQTRGNFE